MAAIFSLLSISASAQLPKTEVTPVDIDREKPQQPILHYYDKHGEPLETPVRFLADLDTVTIAKPKAVYPLFNGVTLGANFFDAIMMAVGQQRANFDISAEVSLANWFFPVVEAGIGFADAHPQEGRCHYKVDPTFFMRAGFNYNFLYKSSPDYQFYIGFRAGYSNFHYAAMDILPGSQFYVAPALEGSPYQKNFYSQPCKSVFGQAVAGLKVKIYRNLAMGWSFRYGFKFKQTVGGQGLEPWFIPGYGTSPISATFSIFYSFR